jgi:cytochrome c peroxidase
MNLRRLFTGILVVCGAIPLVAATTPPVTFSDDETALVLSHGPWPVETFADHSNRQSGKPDAIAFGRELFESPDLAIDRGRSCATCHEADRAFTDGKPRGIGIAPVDRNTPALHNMRLNRWYGWDGKSDSLWAQSIAPILDARELGMTPRKLQTRLGKTPVLADGYRRVFGAAPAGHDAETAMVNIAKALAAYQETIVSGRTAFDKFRDALAERNADGIAAYPDDAKRGLKLFVGRGRCDLCHFGPNFTNGEFHDIGLPHFPAPGRVDKGRYGGIKLLRQSPFSLLGAYNDDKTRSTAGFTRHLRLTPKNWGEFRVPSLRNVAKTAPYMHDGSKTTLKDVVDHYSEIPEDRLHQDGEKLLRPLALTEAESADLIAFLRTL